MRTAYSLTVSRSIHWRGRGGMHAWGEGGMCAKGKACLGGGMRAHGVCVPGGVRVRGQGMCAQGVGVCVCVTEFLTHAC